MGQPFQCDLKNNRMDTDSESQQNCEKISRREITNLNIMCLSR